MLIKRYLLKKAKSRQAIKLKKVIENKSNGGVCMNTTTKRYCTVQESLEQSLKEMQLMRQGKLPKKTWKEYRAEKAKQREKEDGSLN
ncbi:TPA: hypothetical protein LA460_000228 [Clostridium botulinum]|nr:hypothetical protein [Clostridium botulinum]HBJ1652832.1 hypothetical protein [Clostridium botulinum]